MRGLGEARCVPKVQWKKRGVQRGDGAPGVRWERQGPVTGGEALGAAEYSRLGGRVRETPKGGKGTLGSGEARMGSVPLIRVTGRSTRTSKAFVK